MFWTFFYKYKSDEFLFEKNVQGFVFLRKQFHLKPDCKIISKYRYYRECL